MSLLDDGLERIAFDHWQELGTNKDEVPLAVDWDGYMAKEAAGHWGAFTCRVDGEIAAYIAWFIGPSVRYANTMHCEADVYFMLPEYRRGWFGVRFFKEALKALPKPCRVYIGEKVHFQDGRVSILLKRLGLVPCDVIHTAYLL